MPVFSRFTHYTDPLAVQILRRHMGGRPYLVSLILGSVVLGLDIISSFVQMIESGSLLSSIANVNVGANAAAVATGTIIGSFIGILFAAAVSSLGLVARWMIYASAHGRKSPMGTAGFTMQKILAIVSMGLLGVEVLLAFGVFFIFSMFIEFITALFGSAETAIAADLVGVVFIVMLVLLVLVMAYSVFVFIATMQTASRMKATARTGLPGKPIPLFYIINLFIAIISSVLALFITIPSLVISFSFGSLISLLALLPAIASDVLQVIVLLRYRRELKELQDFTPSNAYVPAPQPAVQPAVQPVAQPAPQPALQPSDELRPAVPSTCPSCGANILPGTYSCPGCGRRF